MKETLFLAVASALSILVCYYLANEYLVPYASSGDLIMDNYYVMSLSIAFSSFLSFSFLHIIFDKLFFLKFQDSPRFWLSIRRGLLFGAGIFLFLLFRIWGYRQNIYLFSILFLATILDLTIGIIWGYISQINKSEYL